MNATEPESFESLKEKFKIARAKVDEIHPDIAITSMKGLPVDESYANFPEVKEFRQIFLDLNTASKFHK